MCSSDLTESLQDLLTDINIGRTSLDFPFTATKVKIHIGFFKNFDSIISHIVKIIDERKSLHVVFTGHSLGGAVSTIMTLYCKLLYIIKNIYCITFGSPRVGNKAFSKLFKKYIRNSYRYVNEEDPIPNLPSCLRFSHVFGLQYIDKNKIFYNKTTKLRCCNFFKDLLCCICKKTDNPIDDHFCDKYLEKFN